MSAMEGQDLERYSRQISLSGWEQNTLRNSSVLVAGVGALGCEVAKNLALMGVGKIVLVDNDVVELSNLSRQMLFLDSDIGTPKSVVAGKRLSQMNPRISVETHYEDVKKLPTETFQKADIICSCLDNWGTRRWLNSLAVELRKPLIDGAMEGFYGNLQVVLHDSTPCLECHSEELIPKEIQIAECTLRRRKPDDLIKDLSEHGVNAGKELVERLFAAGLKTIYDIKYASRQQLEPFGRHVLDQVVALQEKLRPKMPALQSVAAVIAGLQAQEALKILHRESIGSVTKGLVVYDAMHHNFTTVDLSKNEDCFVCGESLRSGYIDLKIYPEESVIDLKERIAELFSFPDPEIQFGKKLLSDSEKISEISIKSGDILYLHTTRRLSPLGVKAQLVARVSA